MVVLKIGTNNIGSANWIELSESKWFNLLNEIGPGRDSDDGTAKGVINVVGTLRRLLPNTKILLLSILPRTGVAYFDSIVGINSRIRNLHDGENIFYLDMFNEFRGDDDWGGKSYVESLMIYFFIIYF